MNSFKKTFLTLVALPFAIYLGQTHANIQLMDSDTYLAAIAIYEDSGHVRNEGMIEHIPIGVNSGIPTKYAKDHTINTKQTSELLDFIVLTEYEASNHAIPTIPEPKTYAMLLIGLCLVGLAANRRRTYYF